jgi:hypothetical protein
MDLELIHMAVQCPHLDKLQPFYASVGDEGLMRDLVQSFIHAQIQLVASHIDCCDDDEEFEAGKEDVMDQVANAYEMVKTVWR